MKSQSGYVTLMITLIILTITVIALLYTASLAINQQRLVTNSYASAQAFNAAQAGIDYGIADLIQNGTAISNGTFPTTPVTKTLTNIASQNIAYSYYYTKPYPTTYPSVIQINATGQSADGLANYSMSQQYTIPVGGGGYLNNMIVSRGNVSLSGNASVLSPDSTLTVNTGGSISFSGNANTQSSNSGSNRSKIGTDVVQNDATLAGLSGDQLFLNVFGDTKSQVQSSADVTLSGNVNFGSGNTQNYQGVTIWVNGAVTISGNAKIGTKNNPVFLIVNGNFSISGNGVFYGVVYVANRVVNGRTVTSTATLSGNALSANGAVISEGRVTVSGNGSISHDQTVINNLGLGGTSGPIPGSWVDY